MPKDELPQERYIKAYELEAFVKELQSVVSTVGNVQIDVKKILENTAGVVTYSQLDDKLKTCKIEIIRDVDIRYGSLLKNSNKLTWIIITAVINLLIPAVIYAFMFAKDSL